MKPSAKNIFGLLLAATAWFSVILQWFLTKGSTANFLSYFTVLCNILVALSLSCSILMPGSVAGRFFSKLTVQSAIALYIFIVGLTYNLILRGVWDPKGWQLIVDNLLHVAVPLLYLAYWTFFRSPGNLQWKDGLYWIAFPFAYLVYSLVRGAVINWYPYPFLNVTDHGYSKVAVNICVMIGAFFIAGIAFIALTRIDMKKKAVT